MLLWIQRNPLRSSVFLALASLFLAGGFDLLIAGPRPLIPALVLGFAIGLARRFWYLAIAAVVISSIITIWLGIPLGIFMLLPLVTVALIAAFANRWQGWIAALLTFASGAALVANQVFNLELSQFGFVSTGTRGLWTASLIGFALVFASVATAYAVGRLLFVLSTHVGTVFDRLVADREQARLNLAIGEQNARFEIARDISELVIQRLTAAISVADGGRFTLKSASPDAERVMNHVSNSARQAHQELRRLYDLLNKVHTVSAAPPGFDELDKLIVLYREMGYNITLQQLGDSQRLEEGFELAIYRIVFEALENVRRHVPVGADVTVDFIWTDGGLQVLIKDNGVELKNRRAGLLNEGYSAQDDNRALVETLSGVGLTAMRERASGYSGSIEATKVPGVGFTVSAIFPRVSSS